MMILSRKIYFIIIILLIYLSPYAQRKSAIEIIRDLCSDEMAGRGYVSHGHIKAAKYIDNLYKEYNLRSFHEGSYLQPFTIQTNTFPEDLFLSINGNELQEGIDYLLDPVSGSAKGRFLLKQVNPQNVVDFIKELSELNSEVLKNRAIVLNLEDVKNADTIQLFNELKYSLATICPVIWINEKKFTWAVGKEALNFPIIELKKSFIDGVNEIQIDITNVFFDAVTTHNIIGYIEGKRNKKSVILSAHYDHLGKMGEAIFPGANDNASGSAMLLCLADYFSKNQPKYNVVFIAFGAEEAGILGSKYYVDNPFFPLDQIRFMLNLDILGTGDEGITVVNGTLHKKQFKKLSKLNSKGDYISKIKIRGRAANSDHYWFSQQGIPAFFIYTLGGIKAYHDVYDCPETLPLTEFTDLMVLLIKFLDKI